MTDDSIGRGFGGEWTPADLAAVLSNPFNAIQIDPYLAQPHETILDEETWVQANVRLLEELGPVPYLRNLLMVLKGEAGLARDESEPVSLPDHGEDLTAADVDRDEHHEDESDDEPHASIDADLLDGYVIEQILRRLESEPGIVARSAVALDHVGELDDEITEEVEELEADPAVLQDVIRATRESWDDLGPGAHRLLVHYLLDRVVIGSPDAPLDEQVSIHWRVAP